MMICCLKDYPLFISVPVTPFAASPLPSARESQQRGQEEREMWSFPALTIRLFIFPLENKIKFCLLSSSYFIQNTEQDLALLRLKYRIAGMRKVGRRRSLCGHCLCHSSTPSPSTKGSSVAQLRCFPLCPSSDVFLCFPCVQQNGL